MHKCAYYPAHRGIYFEKFGGENSEPNKNRFGQTLSNRRGQHGKYTVENDLFVTISKIQNSGILLQDQCQNNLQREFFGPKNSVPNHIQFGPDMALQTCSLRRVYRGNGVFYLPVVDELWAEFWRTASFEGFLLAAFTEFFCTSI